MSQRKLAAGVVCSGEAHELAERRFCFLNDRERPARPLAGAAALGAAAVVAALVTAHAADGKEAVDKLLVNRGNLLAQLLGQVGLGGEVGKRRHRGQLRHDSLGARPALPQVAQQPARSAGP